jgi:hypothetical protein
MMSTSTSVGAMVSYAAGSVRCVKIPNRGAGSATRDLGPTMSGLDMDGLPRVISERVCGRPSRVGGAFFDSVAAIVAH